MLGRPNGSIIGATQEPTPTSAGGIWTLPAQLELQKQGKWIAPGYNISRSLRFDSARSNYLSRTPASAGNRKTWTWSGWIKLGSNFDTRRMLFGGGQAGGGTYPNTYIEITDGNVLSIDQVAASTYSTVMRVRTTAVLRDPSSWYHLLVAVDTTQATDTNRVKMYINGVQQTSFSSTTYPSLDLDTGVNTTTSNKIGVYPEDGVATLYFNGYMAEVHFIDGQALDPSYFGVVDTLTGVWRPKQVEDMNYGTNGFYLPFSDNTSTTTLGYDQSGNANNWTLSANFSVAAGANNDSLVDTPTPYGTDTGAGGEVRGNYATLNPLAISTSNRTYTNGNLDVSISALNSNVFGSIQIPTSGKWYWEYQITTIGGASAPMGGVAAGFITDLSNAVVYRSNGDKIVNGTGSAYGATYTTTDIIGVAVNVDGGTVTFYKNGSSQGGITFAAGGLFPVLRSNAATDVFVTNFGQRPFAYTAPSGFKALCTTNLPDPTVLQGDDHFNTVLYTGSSASNQSITNVGFQPDFVWIKSRSNTTNHALFDAVRGADKWLLSNATNAESSIGLFPSFDSNGFTVSNVNNNYDATNYNNYTYVAWNWKANGAGVSNTDGTITSTVSANTTAGISIVTYTSTGANATVGHGLGVAPSMIIIKRRDSTGGWATYHTSVGATKYLTLNLTDAATTDSAYWNNTAPTSTVFSLGFIFANGATYVAYCFAEVEGFSKFGSYTGNGSTDGPFVYTGFRPEFILIKGSTIASNWQMLDATRNPYNAAQNFLRANSTIAEATNYPVDFLSNGFKLRNTDSDYQNTSPYIYMAFASNPFKTSLAR